MFGPKEWCPLRTYAPQWCWEKKAVPVDGVAPFTGFRGRLAMLHDDDRARLVLHDYFYTRNGHFWLGARAPQPHTPNFVRPRDEDA